MEDDRIAILEQQLAQAKQIAEEADRKYEEVIRLQPEGEGKILP
jgi:tropomyosin 1